MVVGSVPGVELWVRFGLARRVCAVGVLPPWGGVAYLVGVVVDCKNLEWWGEWEVYLVFLKEGGVLGGVNVEVCLGAHCVGALVWWGFACVCDGQLLNLECGVGCVV